jgi:hypothetical protein
LSAALCLTIMYTIPISGGASAPGWPDGHATPAQS